VTIESWLNTDDGGPWPLWLQEADAGREAGGVVLVNTDAGVSRCVPGDWVVRDTEGRLHVFNARRFRQMSRALYLELPVGVADQFVPLACAVGEMMEALLRSCRFASTEGAR
jgi:hypothetical protein